MGKLLIILITSVTLFACAGSRVDEQPSGLRDGQISAQPDGSLLAWDGEKSKWMSPEAFWLSYADRDGGLTWGRGKDYPEYDKVKELDTLIIELEQGPCMMMFFHSRWRRANDVRRWDLQYSDYAGCPHVFE